MSAESYGEPWLIEPQKYAGYRYDRKVLNATGEIVIRDGMDEVDIAPIVFSDEELKRVIACVNSCRGISTEDLERRIPNLADLSQELLRAYNQRDDVKFDAALAKLR